MSRNGLFWNRPCGQNIRAGANQSRETQENLAKRQKNRKTEKAETRDIWTYDTGTESPGKTQANAMQEQTEGERRKNSGQAAYERRKSSGQAADERRKSSGQAADERRKNSGQAADEWRKNSGQAAYERRKSSGQAADEWRKSSGQAAGEWRKSSGQVADERRKSSGQAADERKRNNGHTMNEQEKMWKTARELKPDPHKKRAAFMNIQDAIESKKIRNTPSFSELIQIQLQYISPVFWILQGGLLFFLILFLHRLPKQGAELEDYLWWSSILAAWMGVLSHGVLGKHFSYRMAELEQSCYINLTQMWTIRMILTTGVDIGILTVFSGGVASRTDIFFGRIAVYLLVPFVLSNVCCLLMISALRGSRGKFVMAVLAVLTALLAMSPSIIPEIYTAVYLWVWFCLLFFGAVIFAGQLRSCYGRMTRGDLICWN